ncbi:hypothetical protein LCGC14_1844410 [marine sediment metagenome]|uniref:Uncharacterized protein n=1 Tax=marine sediment metagenome TaxID=412755 RepID=A0A0F9GCH8_9ZZZZ
MALTREERELLKEIRDEQREIREEQVKISTVLLGPDGQDGLVEKVDNVADGYGKLKRNFWMLVGVLTGSGVIGGGIGLLT